MLTRSEGAWRIALAIAAVASLVLAPLSPAMTGIVHGLTVIATAVLLIWGPRREEPLSWTRWLLVAALMAALVSELMLVAYQLLAGSAPDSPWAGDYVSFLYTPLTIAGLLLVPVARDGAGNRLRAVCDGLFAAGSLWYLVAALVDTHLAYGLGPGEWSHTATLIIAAGDVCVVATALTVLARCSTAVARTVAGIAAGITVIAADDIWLLVSGHSGYSILSVTLTQIGLLLLLLTAAIPAVRSDTSLRRVAKLRRHIGVLPYLPMLACVGVTLGPILAGHGIPGRQAIPATLMAVVIVVRQYLTSRDREGLVDELQRRELVLEAELRRDALTGLGNRLSLMEHLATVLADPGLWPVAIAVLDLNDFKFINDNHGHVVGDEVLRCAATRLAQAVPTGDHVVRLGGDEFAVVSTQMAERHPERFAGRLEGAFEEPIEVQGNHFGMSASIGIVIGEPPQTADELLAHADAAMYRAKDGKEVRSTVAFLDADERLEVMRDMLIREAIAKPELSQFYVNYQPVLDIRSGQFIGFEALLRWHHPELGNIRPDVFIPLAERAGTIGLLSDHVIRTSAGDLARMDWCHPHAGLRIGINISPHQLTQPAFAERFLAQLEAEGLPPARLTLEVTEQAFAQNLRPVEIAVDALSKAGIRIAVDDFGTGYSTMRYLQRLHPSILKIDRSFVAEVTSNPASHKLVSALTTMALTLGLRVVAEGIETEEQLAVLRAMGCQSGQGFLFSPAVSIGEAERLLDEAPWAPVLRRAAVG